MFNAIFKKIRRSFRRHLITLCRGGIVLSNLLALFMIIKKAEIPSKTIFVIGIVLELVLFVYEVSPFGGSWAKAVAICISGMLVMIILAPLKAAPIFGINVVTGFTTGALGISDYETRRNGTLISLILTIVIITLNVNGYLYTIETVPVWLETTAALLAVIPQALIGVIVREIYRKKDKTIRSVENKANTDKLTGLLNRQTLERYVNSVAKDPGVFSLIMMDIDNFKKVNDTYGHASGDEVLQGLADAVRSAIRGSDRAFRYGGEEFCILCPKCDVEQARMVAERVRTGFAEKEYEFDGKTVSFTVSLGVSDCHYGEYEGLVKLVEKSDSALYRAKHEGKNRVCAYFNENHSY